MKCEDDEEVEKNNMRKRRRRGRTLVTIKRRPEGVDGEQGGRMRMSRRRRRS